MPLCIHIFMNAPLSLSDIYDCVAGTIYTLPLSSFSLLKKRADEQGVSEKCIVHCKDTIRTVPKLNLFIARAYSGRHVTHVTDVSLFPEAVTR